MRRPFDMLNRRLTVRGQFAALSTGAALAALLGGLVPQHSYWFAISAVAMVFAAATLLARDLRTKVSRLSSTIKNSHAELFINLAVEQHAMHCVLNRFPECTLPTTGWSMRFSNLHRILDLLDQHQPTTVLEFGSGLSTLMVAGWLREQGRGMLVSIDHDAKWAEKTQAALARQGLSLCAHVYFAPLVPQAVGTPWYDFTSLQLPVQQVDFVLVDGPPAGIPDLRDSRRPAVPFIHPHLADHAVIVLDDAKRAGETSVVTSWCDEHPDLHAVIEPTYSGLAILRRSPAAAKSLNNPAEQRRVVSRS